MAIESGIVFLPRCQCLLGHPSPEASRRDCAGSDDEPYFFLNGLPFIRIVFCMLIRPDFVFQM